MANIPQNESYGQNNPSMTPGVGYKAPSTLYQNIAQLRDQYNGIPTPPPQPGSPEDFQARQFQTYHNLTRFNGGQGVPTMTRAYVPEGDPHAPIPIPSDYGSFQAPMSFRNPETGEDISWGTPKTPVIRNLNAGDVPSQYIQDTSNPELLVKTTRGENRLADRAMLNGRPSFLYQIDHVMPLTLGGADTLANRQLLTNDDHIKKTRAQSVAYTLYAHKKISLGEARAMAANWRDKDVEDIPDQNEVGLIPDIEPKGFSSLMPWNKKKTGLEIALEAQRKWSQPKPVTVKDVIAGIPEAASNFGKGWMPDDIRAFTMAATSALTGGFISSDIGKEKDTSEKVATAVGYIAGNLFLFSKVLNLVKVPYAAWGSRQLFAKSAAKGILTPATKRGIVMANYNAGGTLSGLTKAAVDAKILAGGASTANKAVGFIAKTLKNPRILEQTGMFAVTNAVMGAASRYVQNHLRPEILAGEEMSVDEQNTVTQVLKDLAIGAIPGAQSPTLKGTLYAGIMPATLTYWQNPDEPLDAIVNGVVFGAMHAHSALNVPTAGIAGMPKYKMPKGYNDVKALGGKPYVDPVTAAQIHVVDHGMNATLNYWASDIIPKADPNKPVPKYSKEQIDTAVSNSIEGILKTYMGVDRAKYANVADEINAALSSKKPTKASKEVFLTQDEVRREIARVIIAGRHLYKRTLPEQADPSAPGAIAELRGKADIDDLISLTQKHLENRSQGLLKILDVPEAAKSAANVLLADGNPVLTKGIMLTQFRTEGGLGQKGFLTGSNVNGSSPEVKAFIEQLNSRDSKGNYTGDASNILIAVHRPEMAPLLEMKNYWQKTYNTEKTGAGLAAVDPTPANAVQVYGIRTTNGEPYLVDLGYVASDYRLNEGKYAINKKHFGEGEFGVTKDRLVDEVMKPKDLDVVLVSADIRSPEGKESGMPYLFFNVSPDGIKASDLLNKTMRDGGYVKPIENVAAKANEAVNNVRMNGIEPVNKAREEVKAHPEQEEATKYLPKSPEGSNNSKVEKVASGMLKKTITGFKASSPEEMASSFEKSLGLKLDPETSKELWEKRNTITHREVYELLYAASQTGRMNPASAVQAEMTYDYIIRSGAMIHSPLGEAALDLPVLGNKPQAPEQPTVTPDAAVEPNAVKDITKISDIKKGDRIRERVYDREAPSVDGKGDPYYDTFGEVVAVSPKTGGVGIKFKGKKDLTWIDDRTLRNQYHIYYGIVPADAAVQPQAKPVTQPKLPLEKPTVSTENPPKNPPIQEKPTVSVDAPKQTPVAERVTMANKKAAAGKAWEYKGRVVRDTRGIGADKGEMHAARLNPDGSVQLDLAVAEKNFKTKSWSKQGKITPSGEKVTFKRDPMPEDAFKTFDEYKRFLVEHEIAHANNPPLPGEKLGDPSLETRMNKIALAQLQSDVVPSAAPQVSVEIPQSGRSSNSRKTYNEPDRIMERDLTAKKEPIAEEADRYLNDAMAATSAKELARAKEAMTDFFRNRYSPKTVGITKGNSEFEAIESRSKEFFAEVDKMAQSNNIASKVWGQSFNHAMEKMLGKDFRNDPHMWWILNRFLKSGFKSWNISQTREKANNQILGDFEGEKTAIQDKSKESQKLPDESGRLNDAELAERGLEGGRSVDGADSSDGFYGMQVVNGKGLNDIQDLTYLENLMLPLFESPNPGLGAALSVKRLFLGEDGYGLKKTIEYLHPRYRGKAKGASISFDGLINSGKAYDRGAEITPQKQQQITEAETLLPVVRRQAEGIKTAMRRAAEDKTDVSNWETPEILQQRLTELETLINKYEKLTGKKDGGGGPGIHDGKGGFFGNTWNKLKTWVKNEPITYINPASVASAQAPEPAPAPAPKPKTYNIRGIEVTDEEFNEIAPALFGEISNRPEDRQKFEIQIALNTGLNRIINNPKHKGYGATLGEVFKKPGAYQGYAPHGTVNERGETVESQYQKAKAGKLDPGGMAKYKLIQDTIEEIKKNGLEDTADGKMFYTHASDGTIWLGSTTEEAVQLAKEHEIKNGLPRTPFNTMRGVAAKTVN